MIARGTNGWNAEMKISDDLLGGWNHAAGMMLDDETGLAVGSAHLWPVSATPIHRRRGRRFTSARCRRRQSPAGRGRRCRPIPQLCPIADSLSRRLRSYDPDGDPLAYQWTQLSGPSVTVSNAASVTAHLSPRR